VFRVQMLRAARRQQQDTGPPAETHPDDAGKPVSDRAP
jgi:hypothetical protein